MAVDYSIIIPAFNEEGYIGATLSRVKTAMASTGLQGEIVVVDNNSTDRTASIVREHDARLVFEPINQISRARNSGARASNGRYLIFLDADTQLSTELLQAALGNLQAGYCCGGGVIVESDIELYWLARKFLNLWNTLSQRFFLAAGCFVYCLRDAFEDCGGFSEEVYASEEIWLSRRLRHWGKSRGLKFTIIQDTPIVTSMRKLAWYSQLQLIFFTLPILLFPLVVRSRFFCRIWYRRPGL